MSVDVYWFVPIIGSSSFRESWPYGPGPTFRPDLAIDIDADVRRSQPVVAPVTGTVVEIRAAAGAPAAAGDTLLVLRPEQT
jgi:hypothetical protein